MDIVLTYGHKAVKSKKGTPAFIYIICLFTGPVLTVVGHLMVHFIPTS